jgi:hypothetical protein
MVHVCARLGFIKGTDESVDQRQRRARQLDYRRAKEHGGYDAADRIVRACMDAAEPVIDHMVDVVFPLMEEGRRLISVVPHPPFDDWKGDGVGLVGRLRVKNALPLQYRARLAEVLGMDIDTEIVQRARVGRTKLDRFPRFLWQPSYTGSVNPAAAYVLVDDVFTVGGTLAALRAHILAGGGTVALMTTLAHGKGRAQPLALGAQTCDELLALFGANFGSFWKREIGHDADCLTEAEGRFLVRWAREEGSSQRGEPLLQRLRDRLFEAAAKGQ